MYSAKNKMLKAKIGSHKDKNVNITDNVMLPFAGIKLSEVPLYIVYIVVCIEIWSIEVSSPKVSSPCGV